MSLDLVLVCSAHRDRQHHQREDRQQVDGTPGTPYPELMNKEGTDADESKTQIDPTIQCGNVPLGAASCTAPTTTTPIAAKA